MWKFYLIQLVRHSVGVLGKGIGQSHDLPAVWTRFNAQHKIEDKFYTPSEIRIHDPYSTSTTSCAP